MSQSARVPGSFLILVIDEIKKKFLSVTSFMRDKIFIISLKINYDTSRPKGKKT